MGIFLQFSSILCRSISTLFTKFTLVSSNAVAGGFYNFFYLVCLTLLLLILQKPAYIDIRQLKSVFIIGIIDAIGNILLFISLNHITPFEYALFGRFYLIFAYYLGIKWFYEKFYFYQLILIILSIIGGVLFSLRGIQDTSLDILYVAICITACAITALSYAMMQKKKEEINLYVILFVANFLTFLAFSLYAHICNDSLVISFKAHLFSFVSAFMLLFSMILFFFGLNFIKYSHAKTIRSLSPVILGIISYPFFPEKLHFINYIGVVIVLLALLLMNYRPKFL